MATSLTYQGRQYIGAGVALDYGIWTATDTSTATITVAGGNIIATGFYDASQNPACNAGTGSTVTLSAKSLSSGITTYTMTPGGTAVTNGTFWIMHGGS